MTNQLQSFLMKEKQTNKKQSEILKLKPKVILTHLVPVWERDFLTGDDCNTAKGKSVE